MSGGDSKTRENPLLDVYRELYDKPSCESSVREKKSKVNFPVAINNVTESTFGRIGDFKVSALAFKIEISRATMLHNGEAPGTPQTYYAIIDKHNNTRWQEYINRWQIGAISPKF